MARADRATWAKRVERWKDSGLTAKEFASELGVSAKALSWWKWQLGKDGVAVALKPARKARTAVSPLTFVEMVPPTPMHSEPLEVVFPSGVRIRVPVDFDAGTLGRLIAVVDKR